MVDINWLNKQFQMKAPNQDNNIVLHKDFCEGSNLKDASNCYCNLDEDEWDLGIIVELTVRFPTGFRSVSNRFPFGFRPLTAHKIR